MFAKMAFRNIRSKINDYLIYLFTLTALSAMMLSAFMLPVFPVLSDNDSGAFMSNSLPAIIALTLLFLMLYMNRFMLRRRSQEFAIYMLSGVPQDKISLLYFGEHILLGLLALAVGLFFGLILFCIILTIFSATWTFGDLILAVLQTCVYYIATHVASLVITIFYIKRLNIKNLLGHHKDNEQIKLNKTRLILLSTITMIAFPVLFYQIINFDPFTASTLIITIGIIIYGAYTSILGWLSWYRNKQGNLLYKDMRLFIIGQLMSKIKTVTRMSTVISCCLLCAMCSFIAGWIFTGNAGLLLGGQDDVVMGFAQFYIAVLFTVIVFSVIALQQIVDIREYRQKFTVLRQLGTNTDNLNRILFKQVFLNFTLPVSMAVILMLFCLYPLEQIMNLSLGKEYLVIHGAFIYLGIFAVLYICYMIATYISLIKIIYT